MTGLNWEARFRNNSYVTYDGRPSRKVIHKNWTRKSWWTPERDAKLRYIMEKYGPVDYFEAVRKASRVLGSTYSGIENRYRQLLRNDAEELAEIEKAPGD